jgi:hypothetical protein
MPDFDKDLNPILANTDTSPLDLPNPATPVPHSYADLGGGRGAQGSAMDSFFGNGPVVSNMLPTVTAKELYENRRYGTYASNIIDLEDQKAYAQSGWDKAANGILKGLNLAGTTVAGSFGMLVGAAKAPFSGRLADIWDNPIMRELDEWNNEVDQVYLPNYYTNAENNAAWYSTDNWFKTNWLFDKLIKNSGFAVGAMVSGNIANAGLIRAGAALGKAAAAGATAAEASQAFKLFTPLLKNTSRAFSAGKNIEAAAVLEKEISSIADITAKSSKLAEIAKQTNKFANFGDTGRRTLVAAYSSAGEASFEALQTSNQYRDGLIEDYKSKHGGLDPVGEDLDNINEMSEKVGKTSFFGNLALLSVTEYVQLPKLLGSNYSSSRQAANSLLGRTDDVLMKDGKYIAAPRSTTKFGKVYDKITDVGKYVFDPKEAAQEIGQYALQVGTNNYFNKAYQTNVADEWVDGFLYGFVGRGEDGEGVGAFVSKEGMESALMGGLTGGLMQARGTFQESRATKNNTQQFLSQINTAPSFQKAFKERMQAINRGVVLQQQQQDAIVQGDKLEAKDLDADMMHNYLAPRIKYGRFGMVLDDIAELRTQAMSEKGFGSLKEEGVANINDTVDTYLARLSLFENTAKNIEELYKSLNLRYGGQIDESGRRLYTDEVIDKMVYAASKVADYDLRIPQVAENLVNSNIRIEDAIKTSIDGPVEDSKKAEIDVLSQIDGTNSLNKDELKLDFFEVRELNARRKKFLDEYNDIKSKPAEYREAEAIPDQPVDENVEKTTVKIKTVSGEEEYEIGTEYFLGKVVKKDDKGNVFNLFPKLTILGENEDGTIKIKDSNGKLHDMTRNELLGYKLGKVSDTLTNKKAKWFLENSKNIFEFNFGKGKKVQGTLRYSHKEGILEFTYVNSKGEEKSIEVTGDQFVAKNGFLDPMIKKVGEYTASEQQLLEQFAAQQDPRKVDKRAARLSVLNELFEEVDKNQKKVTTLLEQKKNEFETISKELKTLEEKIASGDLTKRNNFKASTNRAIKAANRLSRMQEQLRLEIESLEAERDEAELTLQWISDVADNIDELPTDSKEFLEEIKSSVSLVEDYILSTGKTINDLSDLVNRAEEALESAIDMLRGWINQFEKAYPKVPTILGQEWVDFLKANPNFLKLAPKFKEDLAMLEDIVAQTEDFTIKPKEEEIKNLRDKIENLQEGLAFAEKELKIKALIVSRFEQVAKDYQKQEEQKARILKNEALIAEVLGSADPGLQTRAYDSSYEAVPKKSDIAVVTSTKVPSKSDQPHVKRANLFGIKFPKLKNRNKIKGVVISAKNEAEFGLGGLTQHLKEVSDLPEAEKAKIDPSKTVALVMVVETKSGSYRPVDVDGNVIDEPSFDNAIYQAFPDPSLEWSEQYGGGSMFRKETADNKTRLDYYKGEYAAWHSEMLNNPTNLPHSIEASFGKPEIPTKLDESGKEVKLYDTRTPVSNAGLINESDLQTAPVIFIPTTNNIVSKGSTFFDSPLGRPFLKLANAYVKLMNRKLTSNEASTIYDAIYQLSLDVNENGNAKSEKSKRLINWLKSIIYWGTPKNVAGYNSVFFDRTEEGLKIFFSGKEKSYFFTPQSIKDNKDEILTILGGMYNNINSGLTDKDDLWNQPYEEIIGFDKDGNPIAREVDGKAYWPNYQTYLLSGKGRKPEELPLSVQMRPLADENDVNRDGVYFTLTDTADTERYNKPPKPVTPLTPVGAAPVVAPAQKPLPAENPPVTPAVTAQATLDFKLNGSENTIAIGNNGDATFTLDINKYIDSNGAEGFGVTAKGETVQALMTNKGYTQEQAVDAINKYIASKVKPIVDAEIARRQAPVAPAPQAAPVVTDAARVIGVDYVIENKEITVDHPKGETATPIIDYKAAPKESYEGTKVKVLNTIADTVEAEVTYPDGEKFTETFDRIDFENKVFKIAAAEEVKPAEPAPAPVTAEPAKTATPSAADMALIREQMRNMSAKTPLRKKIEQEVKNFKPENWNKVEKWLKANFPNIPVYRVKNIIQATNGQQAWGMFKDGAIYIYENAEVGTAYHEVFHAVWRMFSDPVEQAAVIAEVKARKGMENATEEDIEELLAEEFRDYVQFKKVPGKPAKGRPYIVKLFNDMVNFIKEFFTGKKAKSNTEELFKKIGSGYYANSNTYQSSLAFAKQGIIDVEEAYASSDSAFRIKGIPANEVNDIMQQMTYTTLTDLIRDNKSLFTIPKLKRENRKELYERLLADMQETVLGSAKAAEANVLNGTFTEAQAQPFYDSAFTLWKKVTDNWEDIKKKHEEYLKMYDIEFDENDQVQMTSDERSKETGWMDATKIDSFKKANGAIKLLLSTIPIVTNNNDFVYSNINGVRLLPTSQVFMSLMNNLHTSLTIDEMMERLRDMAKNDPNYRTLYSRLTNTSYKSDTLDLGNISEVHDGQLLAAFWRTFKKQNPDVKNVYIFENGDIEVGDSSLSTAARQVASEYVENFKKVLTGTNPYFTYSNERKAYIGKPEGIKDVKEGFKKASNEIELIDRMIAFLDTIGIDFKRDEIVKLPGDKQDTFKASVNGIIASIEKAKNIATISGKVLDFQGRFMSLSTLRAAINNPEFDSTFFNVKGERVQSFIGTNASSDLFDALSQVQNKSELANTPYAYLLTDEFAQFSVIMDKMFNKETGDRIKRTEDILKPGYVDGTVNQKNGKKKESSKLNYKERLVQEINMNLKGYYYNLVPGDASIEWMTYMTNHVSAESLLSGFSRANDIFKGYFLSEFALAKSNRPIASLKGRKETDLRFLKPILGEELHNQIIKEKGTPEEVYSKYERKINKALEDFITKDADNTKASLFDYGIIKPSEKGYNVENIAFSETEQLTDAVLNRQLNALSINYMINNIEMHKLLYSDPYQYKDELKRVKSFNSPRQAIINGSKPMNAAFNNIWNKGRDANDIGRTNFIRDYFRTATIEDVLSTSDLQDYGVFEETDGGGIISFKAYRNFRIRAGEWNDEEEQQFIYDVAYEKIQKKLPLNSEEQKRYDKGNPKVQSAYTPLKPIVSGNKANGKSYNDVLLDKFALYPLSYRVAHELNSKSNAVKQHDKMQKEDIDYTVFGTGRKVGAEKLNPIYNEDGSFNNAEYEGIINVPFGIMSIQSEVPSKDTPLVTRGSQATKLVTMDYMEAGVPTDFQTGKDFNTRFKAWKALKTEEAKEKASPLYKEIKNNQTLLTETMKEGFFQLMKEMGITESVSKGIKSFKITNFDKAAKTLRGEILKREVNDNIEDALAGFLNGEAVLEATPAYQQVRNILYSIADKRVISPKISGGQKVQIPSTFFEENRLKAEGKEGKAFSSEILEFYKDEDGKRVCEIMVGRWFNTSMSDEALLEYLNNTPEGQKVLAGVAFRIPTQKQNSIDVFRIKKFLPKEFGDSVVIPSALVKKVGSDFDIDKLSIYFKNVLVNAKGEPKIVPFFGYGEQAKKKISEWLITNELETLFDVNKEDPNAIDNLTQEDEEKDLADIDKYYKKSLENAYIESMEKLITHPLNFKRLTTPNSADQLKNLSKKITKKLGFEAFDYSSTSNMLSRRFMSRLRHAFVTGKYAIGIAAVSQTNHSLNQRQPIYIDINRFDNLDAVDKHWLTTGTGRREDIDIKFDKFNMIEVDGKMVPTLSMIENAAGQDISDINGQFIDGYVDISKGPWIMELGATPNVASTWLFLAKVGVPIDTIANFMNQPIVRDYLRSIESAGYSYLFMEDFVTLAKDNYKSNSVISKKSLPSSAALFEMVGNKELDNEQKAQQQFILDEFLKYAKMAEQLFNVTQGSNFDTSTFNDPYLVFKKEQQLIKAQRSIISSVDKILESSFIGPLYTTILDVRKSFAEILKSDQPAVRDVVQTVLMDYIDLPDNEFVQVARKVVNDLFDWAVQIDRKLNTQVQNILLSDNNAAKEITDFVTPIVNNDQHPLFNNLVVKSLIPKFADAKDSGKTNNLKIKNKDNKVYDQNKMIYAFQELREYLKAENSPLYGKLVRLAVLQSGLSNSPISFTSLIPYEDFKEIYNKTISTLETFPNLKNFADLKVFQRNNWNNDDYVPYRKGRLRLNEIFMSSYYTELSFGSKEDLTRDIKAGRIPQVIRIDSRSAQADSDVIVYSWEVGTKKEIREKRAKGDFSFIQKGLFKKVYTGNDPLIYPGKKGNSQYIYKMINAWGDSFRANEFYDSARKSVVDNGFLKVNNEVSDETIVAYFEGSVPAEVTSKPVPPKPTTENPETSVTPREQEIKDKIELFEMVVNSGNAKPEDYKILNALYTELGKIVKSKC